MSHLYIQITDPSLLPLYQAAITKFNASKNDAHRDSGFDLFVPDTFTTNFGDTYSLNHNVICASFNDYGVPYPYYMYPRSSISKTPLRLANCVGVIDSGYRGHLIAKLDHIKPSKECKKFIVQIGSRMVQVCSHNLLPFESVNIVDTMDETKRGDGGFGSTGGTASGAGYSGAGYGNSAI